MLAIFRFARFVRVLVVPAAMLIVSSVSSSAQVVRMLKNLSGETVTIRSDVTAIDAAGTTIYGVASSNQYGTNPGFRNQIFQWNAATGAGVQLTNFPLDILTVSVSDDGQWLAFVSNGDLTGGNHDESYEVFVMHPDGTGLSQVTNDTSRVGYGVGTATISGSGNRIAFTADTDPLGTNPQRAFQHFVVDRDGSNVVQLTAGTGVAEAAGISDDGNRVVYSVDDTPTSSKIYASPADGSTAPVLIQTLPTVVDKVVLSGNGQVVVSELQDGTLAKVNFDGTGAIAPLTSGISPSITDDGLTVFYVHNGVSKIGSDGTGATLVAAATSPLTYRAPRVSGSGNRVAAIAATGQIPGGNNPDQGSELAAMDGSGANLLQLTLMAVRPASCRAYNYPEAPVVPRILTNGSRVYFVSDGDPFGTNADHSSEVFTMLPTGTGLAQVTNLTSAGVETLSVSDGGVIVFESYGAVTGPSNGNYQFYKINTNGTGLTKLTNFGSGPAYGRFPIVRFDGNFIVYEGFSTTGVPALLSISINGGASSTIIAVDSSSLPIFNYRLSTIPNPSVVYDAPGNLDGHNPNGRFQIQKVGFQGAGYLRITADPDYDSLDPDISGDGSKVVWYSQANFTGQNPNHSYQIFLYDVTTASIRQLTSTTGRSGATLPSITRDGTWVYYNQDNDVLRVSVASGAVQRVTGFTPEQASFADVDGTGAKALFIGNDVIHQSPSWTSLFLSDQTGKPAFHVGKAAPTLLDWDPDPQSLTYDVIRGDLANLATLAGTVDLGTVICLENDSPDNATLGNEDATQPSPGHGFFYLYRGTVGSPPVAASWGQGTSALERIPGTGSCSP